MIEHSDHALPLVLADENRPTDCRITLYPSLHLFDGIVHLAPIVPVARHREPESELSVERHHRRRQIKVDPVFRDLVQLGLTSDQCLLADHRGLAGPAPENRGL